MARETDGPTWWAWQQVVEHEGRLGIPSFQRGAVWDSANRAALLESLFEASPCGTLVMWEPDHDGAPTRFGVSLQGTFADGARPMWLVDGQQRCRTLLSVYNDLIKHNVTTSDWALVPEQDMDELRKIGSGCVDDGVLNDDDDAPDDGDSDDETQSDGEDDEESTVNVPAVWHAVLPAISAFESGGKSLFGDYANSRNVQRARMFRTQKPRARTQLDSKGVLKPVPRPIRGTIPLAALLAPTSIFSDSERAAELKRAVDSLLAGNASASELSELDKYMPWGPQFVTGFVFKQPAVKGTDAAVLRWADLQESHGDDRAFLERLAALLSPTWRPVVVRFGEMFTQGRLGVGWLPSGSVSDAIDAYVRINRAGIRVRAEERALALLTRARPVLLDDLADYIEKLSGDRPEQDDARKLLTHESDKQMGFGIWVTLVTRYTTLSLMGEQAIKWLGVEAIDKKSFIYRLSRAANNESTGVELEWRAWDFPTADELVQRSAAKASGVLLFVDRIYTEKLSLDHRMARPPVRGLYPLFDLLYRVSQELLEELQHDDDFRSAIARLMQWLLLLPYLSQRLLEGLIHKMHGLDPSEKNVAEWGTREQVRRAMRRLATELWLVMEQNHKWVTKGISGGTECERLSAAALAKFDAELEGTKNMRNPAVGWLYALERRNNAKEFNWVAQFRGYSDSDGVRGIDEKECGAPGGEKDLSTHAGDLSPERQHIVPFSKARKLTPGTPGNRASSTDANCAGNLTWLSQRQNALNALSDRWTVMDPITDNDNLHARGMLHVARQGVYAGKTALQLYEELQRTLESDAADPTASALFKAFWECRQEWMGDQMGAWLAELSSEARAWLEGGDDSSRCSAPS